MSASLCFSRSPSFNDLALVSHWSSSSLALTASLIACACAGTGSLAAHVRLVRAIEWQRVQIELGEVAAVCGVGKVGHLLNRQLEDFDEEGHFVKQGEHSSGSIGCRWAPVEQCKEVCHSVLRRICT